MNIDELEKLRKKAKNTFWVGIFVSIIVTFIVIKKTYGIFFTIYPLIIFILIKTISYIPKKNFLLAFKKYFIESSLKNIFTDLDYVPEKGIEEYIIGRTNMIKTGNRYSSSDYVSAKYRSIKVTMSNILTQSESISRDSEGNMSTDRSTLFRGEWIMFDFNKSFSFNIKISQKGFKDVNHGLFAYPENQVKMIDEEFNEQFKIYGQNEFYISLILTPSIMEKMKKIANICEGKIMFGFIGSKLHIAIYNKKDLLKHSVFKKIDEPKILDEMTNTMKLITSIVDELIDNTNINSAE